MQKYLNMRNMAELEAVAVFNSSCHYLSSQSLEFMLSLHLLLEIKAATLLIKIINFFSTLADWVLEIKYTCHFVFGVRGHNSGANILI